MQAPKRQLGLREQCDSHSHQQRGVPKRPRTVPTQHERYDYDTGQVYTETIYKVPKDTRPWYRHANGSVSSIPSIGKSGPSSLKRTAMRTLLRNLDCLEPESLQGLDWTIGQELLRTIERNQLKSFEVWRIFATRYYREKPGNYKRYLSDTYYELDIVIEDLTKISKGAPLLTFLTVNDCLLPSRCYSQLSELPSLAVLKLWETGRSDTLDGFNERILGSWQAAVVNGGSFRNLRALELTDIGLATGTLLPYVEHFRNLSLIRIVSPCQGMSRTTMFGSWKQPHDEIKRSKALGQLFSGQIVSHDLLLECALESSSLPQVTLPACTISYGRNEATRYYGERPSSSEVWVRALRSEKRSLLQQIGSLPASKKRSTRIEGNKTTLGDMLAVFGHGSEV